MVRRVRLPAEARHLFTANQLYGWPESVQYSPAPLKAKPQPVTVVLVTPPPQRVSVGRKLA